MRQYSETWKTLSELLEKSKEAVRNGRCIVQASFQWLTPVTEVRSGASLPEMPQVYTGEYTLFLEMRRDFLTF